ncbi:hypothetical protein HHI36_022546 [Cryptolaemus montrouzieri]|uniref:Uncharacterized protein n=1 Tax=Cryptolaemus montrouzieri TaxID=559131 RepID=A0ABD2N0C2_9CUCU
MYEFYPTVEVATRERQIKSLIYNIFVNFDNDYEYKVLKEDISDHHGQMVDFMHSFDSSAEKLPCVMKIRVFSRDKLAQLNIDLGNICWERVFQSEDVDSAYNIFTESLVQTFKSIAFPLQPGGSITEEKHNNIECRRNP